MMRYESPAVQHAVELKREFDRGREHGGIEERDAVVQYLERVLKRVLEGFGQSEELLTNTLHRMIDTIMNDEHWSEHST